MTTTFKKLTFEEFLEQYPDGYGIYELVNGEIVQVEPIRAHKNVARFLLFAFNDEIRFLCINYSMVNTKPSRLKVRNALSPLLFLS